MPSYTYDSSTVTIGHSTKKSDYDRLRYNIQHIKSGTCTFSDAKTFNGTVLFNSATTYKGKVTSTASCVLNKYVKMGTSATVGGQLGISGGSRVIARRTASQSIPTASATIIIYNNIVHDNLSELNTSTGRITVIKPGLYLCIASCVYNNDDWLSNTDLFLDIYVNAALYTRIYRRIVVPATTTPYHHLEGSRLLYLSANDIVDIRTYHDRGSSRTVLASTTENFLCLVRLQ